MLNASSLINLNDSKPPLLLPRKLSTAKSNEFDQNQAVYKLLNNVKQIDSSSDVSCLLNESVLYKTLKDYLENFASTQSKKAELLECIRDNLGGVHDGENIHLYLNTFYRWFNMESHFNLSSMI